MLRRSLLGVILIAVPALAQRTGGIRVTANVAKVTFLNLAAATRQVRLIDSQPMISVVHLQVTRPADSSTVVIPLIARSNIPYRLSVRGSDPASVRVLAIKPLAGGEHVNKGSWNIHTAGEAVIEPSSSVTLFEGPRISSGGNNATPDNAVLIELGADLMEGMGSTDLTFQMVPILD